MKMDSRVQFSWRWSALCVGCAALLLAAGCSNRRSEQYRGEGDTQLLQLKNTEKAREAYQNSIEANPENPLAHLGLARCDAAEGNNEAAIAKYEDARALDPDLPEAYMEPIWIDVELGNMEDAIALAKSYAEVEPEKGGRLHSVVLLRAGRIQEATALLESLREQYPESAEIRLSLGVAYSEEGRTEEAIALLSDLAHGSTAAAPAAQTALIDVSAQAGQIDALVADFELLVEEKPDDQFVKMGYARSLLLAGEVEKAEETARNVLDIQPQSGWANYIVGVSKLRQGSAPEAVAFLENAVEALPEEEEVAKMLDAARAGKMPAEQQPESPTRTAGAKQVANTTWRDLWQQAALQRLLDNRSAYLAAGNTEVREYLAMTALFMRDNDLARELASELPEDSKVGGFFKVMEERNAENIAAYFEAWRPAEPERELLRDNALAYAMAAGGSRGQALSVLLFCLERWPDNTVALFNIAQVFRSLGQPEIAAQQFQQLIARYPENIDAHQMRYDALRAGSANEKARQAAEASFNLFPEEKWSFLNLSEAYAQTDDLQLSIQVLERGKSLFPGDPEMVLASANILVRMGDCEAATGVLSEIASTAPAIRTGRAFLEALCAARDKDWDAILKAANEVDAAGWPDGLALLAAAAHSAKGDTAAALDAIKSRDGTPAANNFGRIIAAALGGKENIGPDEQAWAQNLTGDPGLLQDYAIMAALLSAQLHDTAWTHYQNNLASRTPHIALAQLAFAALARCGNVEDPAAEGRAIAESLQGDSRAWLGLAGLLQDLDDTEGHDTAIARAVESGPDNPEVWFRNAMAQEKRGDIEGAVESYRKLLELQPDSPAANNNLAYMLLRLGGNDQEALEKAALARDKMPTDPGVLHTLGLAQMKTGDLEASKKSLVTAAEINPANPTIMFDYGRVLLELGDKESAKRRIGYALSMSQRAGLEFPEEAEADSLLGSIE